MTPKEAVAAAKSHIEDTFAGELDYPSRLEEIWFDEGTSEWCVTFTLWRRAPALNRMIPGPTELKVVRVRDVDGRATSIRNRDYSPV